MTEEQGPRELREAYDRAIARVKELESENSSLRGEVRGSRISRAGFAEGTKEHSALLKYLDESVTDNDAIQEFASSEFGFTPGKGTAPSVPAVDAVESGDAVVAQMPSTQVEPQGRKDELVAEIQKAESEGRLLDAVSLKNRLLDLQRTGS